MDHLPHAKTMSRNAGCTHPEVFKSSYRSWRSTWRHRGQILLDVPLGIPGSRAAGSFKLWLMRMGQMGQLGFYDTVGRKSLLSGKFGGILLVSCGWSRSPPDWMALRRARRTRRTRHDGFNLYILVGLWPCVYIYFWSFRICFFFLIFCFLFFFGPFQCFSYFFSCRIMNMARFARIPEEQVQEGQWAMLNCWLSFLPLLKWSILWFSSWL